MDNYNKIIKKIIYSKIPKRFRDVREYIREDNQFNYKQTTITLFSRQWYVSGYLPQAFVITNFSANNTMNDYIEYNTKRYLIHKHCKVFDSRKDVTNDEAYKAKILLLWLIYFYYARY